MPSQDYRRKLIEVEFPLSAVHAESAREKFLRDGLPSSMATYWARRPLAACRAVLFASLVDDPADCREEFPTIAEQDAERTRLHKILISILRWEELDEVKADGIKLISAARLEIARSLARHRDEPAPIEPKDVLNYLVDQRTGIAIYDPFCGGGSIPLEAQRLGLQSVGSDLNPVAVLITKSMTELPVPFSGRKPMNPDFRQGRARIKRSRQRFANEKWLGYAGMSEDIRYYGRRVRSKVLDEIGHLYPLEQTVDGRYETVVAWLWANTVPCSNPACGINMPLISNFQVSKRDGRLRWAKPIVNREANRIDFAVVDDSRDIARKGTVANRQAICIACDTTVPLEYVRTQAKSGKLRQQLVAMAIEGDQGRTLVSPNELQQRTAQEAVPPRRPQGSLPHKAISIRVRAYGFTEWHQLFTERQLTMLCSFSDALSSVHDEIMSDGASQDYAKAVCTYLALAVGRLAHTSSRLCMWVPQSEHVAHVFGRQALGMVWDFAESNPFCSVSKNWTAQVARVVKAIERLPLDVQSATTFQADAANTEYVGNGPVIVTDPPYYDNIGYADISDFFYIWYKDMLSNDYPALFMGKQTPKSDEIVAGPMFENPKERFELLMSRVLSRVRKSCTAEYPSSIFYAYKQKEEEKDGVTSTGWETFLSAVNEAGFQVVGTWPVRTESSGRLNALKGNTLASSVVLVTRPRDPNAGIATRQQFVAELESALPAEIDRLTREGHIAPIDLAQAAIGPGMKVYTRYSAVETIAGEPVSVKDALKEINRVLAEYFLRQHGELDSETRFCLDWLAAHDFNEGPFGDAETLAKAKDVAVDNLRDEHKIVRASRNAVQLIPYSECGTMTEPPEVGPATSAWLGLMRIAWHFDDELGRGIEGAGNIIRDMTGKADQVERLARILFNHYDRKFRPSDARVFNDIAGAWPGILEQSRYGRQLTQ